MAKKYKNDSKFLIIEMTPDEAVNTCYFGCQGILVDDDSNELLNNEEYVYYVAVLNRLFNKKTLESWLNNPNTIRYTEDIPYEEKHYNYYAKLLEL